MVTFYWPRLRLPDSSEFQVFASDHPFEQYDFKFRDLFWFEKAKHQDAPSRLPVRVVWGVMPLDNGDYLNPLDRGGLVLDETFDIAAPDSQSWLRQFCRQLRNQSFYQSTPGPLLPNCFIETFRTWMMQECEDAYSKDRAPCCKKSSFPFERKVFNLCVRRCIKSLYKTPFYYEMPGVAGPRFLRETGRIQVVVVEYDSKFSFTYSYNEMQRFVGEVDRWVSSQMATAPPGMRNGWFVSYMDTYDLQDSLAHGTVAAIGVAMAIAAVVLFLTTLNVLITLYAILTVACIIFVTVAALVLLGWKLNMLESVVVSVAIGLAVDFTLHYGIVYRLSSEEDRESSVIFSIGRMGSPIAMAAFTTFLAGLAMLPSNVLGYIRIGTFVMIVMTVSWLYSTLFFQSLLRLFGPQGRFGQFRYPSLRCCTPSSSHVDKTAYSYALSESTMSTSSIGFAGINTNPNESHELESLTVANAGGVVVGRSRSSDRLTVCGTVGGHRYLKHKSVASSSSSSSLATRGAARQRSGSMSAVVAYDRDLTLATLVTRPSRKVSLPTCSIDPSPRHVSITTSSTTIVFSDEVDRDQTA